MKSYIFIISLIFLVSCDNDEQIDRKLASGTYIGTFQREHVLYDTDTANITITFNSNEWSGTSDIEKYPALCHGTYSIIGEFIYFENDCGWTAEFDHSLILGGKYSLNESDSIIEFIKVYQSNTIEAFTDRYKLKKNSKNAR